MIQGPCSTAYRCVLLMPSGPGSKRSWSAAAAPQTTAAPVADALGVKGALECADAVLQSAPELISGNASMDIALLDNIAA